MSDFASLLSSFKATAASASDHSSRKRPRPVSSTSAPSFPSLQTQLTNKSFHLSFLIIGGQKCGTTWLHTQLQKCKHISLPKQKEIHFWDWYYRRGLDWYIRQFESTNKFIGEITPDYVALPSSAIAEIRNCFPDLKIVFVARDLVDRAWSAMVMELRDQNMGLNPGVFSEGVIQQNSKSGDAKRAKLSIAQTRKMQQLASPTSQPDSYFMERLQSDTHTSRSDYASSLKRWYTHFPDESIYLVNYREVQSDPRGVLCKIVEHIGVDKELAKKYVQGLDEATVKQRVNASTNNCENAESMQEKFRDSSYSLLKRPLLKKQMEKYLTSYACSFNDLLQEKGYSFSLNDYKQK